MITPFLIVTVNKECTTSYYDRYVILYHTLLSLPLIVIVLVLGLLLELLLIPMRRDAINKTIIIANSISVIVNIWLIPFYSSTTNVAI